MKKSLLAIITLSLSAGVLANNLDQAKIKTVAKMYAGGGLKKYVTPSFRKLLKANEKLHEELLRMEQKGLIDEAYVWSCDYDPDYDYGRDSEPGKPTFKVVDGKVHATYLTFKDMPNSEKETLVYTLECSNNQCLISDFGKLSGEHPYESHKKKLSSCLAEMKKKIRF